MITRLLSVLATVALTLVAHGGEPIVTTDLLRIQQVTSIDVSRDGQHAVYSVRSIGESTEREDDRGDAAADPIPAWEYRSHLYRLDLFERGSTPRQLTYGSRRDTEPVISPDGRRVAFVRDSDVDDENGERLPQIWVINLDGGEAAMLTSMEHGAGAPRWSPDGSTLLVESSLPVSAIDGKPSWPMERPKRDWNDGRSARITPRPDGTRQEIRVWLARNAAAFDPNVINRLDFQGEQTLQEEMAFTQLFSVDVDNGTATPLTSDFFNHTKGRFVGSDRVVYVSQAPVSVHIDRVLERRLWIMNADGTSQRTLVDLPGWAIESPRPSQDGKTVAFTGSRLDEPMYRQRQLGVVTINGEGNGDAASDPVWLTDENVFDFEVRGIEWLPARSTILFNAARHGGVPLYTIGEGLLEPASLLEENDGLPVGVQRFAAAGGTVVYAVTSVANPCVLRVADGRGDRIVHDLNPWVANKDLSLPRGSWITRPDGTRVQCWLMEPTNREDGRTYPLALEIHGGPSAMWGPGEDTMWHEFQLLCSWGYGVVYSNPRGSGGYGYGFQRGNHQNWGDGPAGDVLAAVDLALREPWVDRDRLVMTGGSYAGYLTAWIVGNDHRFKAAVAQRGVYDMATFFGEGNAWRLVPWTMGGYPWDGRVQSVMRRESPFTYVNRIRTPLMIMHASQDLRTGVSQSEMMYRALKELDRPVEYVRYPEAGHDLSRSGDPHQRMDRLNRIIEFFERHIENERAAPREKGSGPFSD